MFGAQIDEHPAPLAGATVSYERDRSAALSTTCRHLRQAREQRRPAIDHTGSVVGVIVAGAAHEAYPNDSVHISHLDHVVDMPVTALP